MKTKDNLKTGIIIGICTMVMLFTLSSTTNYSTPKTNKFEIHTQNAGANIQRLVILNTETGEVKLIMTGTSNIKRRGVLPLNERPNY